MAKILMVLDGSYRFSPSGTPVGTTDFTYVALVGALTNAGHQVTKAHRQSDSSADHQSFAFASTLNLLEFDMMWLIGFDGRNVSGTSTKLPDAELAAITNFMNAGGGVFATGDHDSIGSNMSGHILRVRAMRCWYGAGDTVSPMPADFPRNFPPTNTDSLGFDRAETGRLNPAGDYDLNNDGTNEAFIWFENQSDSIPQPITPTSPTHPILKRADGAAITVYPDHMHEGNTLGEVAGYPYDSATATYSGQSFTEFPLVADDRPLPEVIATGQSVSLASRMASSPGNPFVDSHQPTAKPVNTLSAYDGRKAGVGRVVTGSTFHHYVDINLTGDTRIDTPAEFALTGPDAEKNHGFNDNPVVFDDIKRVFDNITNWLARPRPKIQLILERSTFSQAEATANSNFPGAILVVVDGLKPNQFPGGGITTLSPVPELVSWAPTLTPLEPAGLNLVPTGVASDDPELNDRLQRITFTYRVEVPAAAFTLNFPGDFKHVTVDANLTAPAASNPLTDSAQITLTKSANPFMLDLDGGNDTPWLSSDVRVFPIVAGAPGSPLPNNATRQDAIAHLQSLLSGMTVSQFQALATGQSASALSPLPTTTGSPARKVYNFAVARVRLPSAGASASGVRVFFRIFTSQTTAALTYIESPPGNPVDGYKKTPGVAPIALPGTNGAGTEWLSFPMFADARVGTPASQPDSNVKPISPGNSTFFGCLIDNNLSDPYLPPTPTGGGAIDLPTLMMGEHQCIVAQIEFLGTPIPSGANPFTSDKLAQRNIALSEIANPGLDASRRAFHTFEMEAAPHAVSEALLPDELLLEWRGGAPKGTEVRLFIPGWKAEEVVALADRFYPRHEIRAVDAHTVALPGGGTRFVPVPPSRQRQTGVIIADLPIGVKKGQRYDLSVRQVTNRGRRARIEPPKVRQISLEEAKRLLAQLGDKPDATRKPAGEEGISRGVFEIAKNTVLVTDLSVLDGHGDHAVIIERPDPEHVAAVQRREGGKWRETIGAFQLGIPVSVKADMLVYHVRLLSMLRWRAEHLRPTNRWYAAFVRYVELVAEKVRALGGNPDRVPATPDGSIPLPGKDDDDGTDPGPVPGDGGSDSYFEPGSDDWLGGTHGLVPIGEAKPGIWSGKVSGLLFDHFGDFEGFTLETYDGSHLRFFSRERAIRDLVSVGWAERQVMSVITTSAQSRRVRRILVRGYS